MFNVRALDIKRPRQHMATGVFDMFQAREMRLLQIRLLIIGGNREGTVIGASNLVGTNRQRAADKDVLQRG